MSRTIFHIDVNSAYLSWTAVEQLKNGAKTDIRTIPAIIGGNQESRHAGEIDSGQEIWDPDRRACGKRLKEMPGYPYRAAGS